MSLRVKEWSDTNKVVTLLNEACVCRPGIQVTMCVCVCVDANPTGVYGGHRLQGAKKETINLHCDVQTRPGSHGWVTGAMEVMRVRCGSIINKNDAVSLQ